MTPSDEQRPITSGKDFLQSIRGDESDEDRPGGSDHAPDTPEAIQSTDPLDAVMSRGARRRRAKEGAQGIDKALQDKAGDSSSKGFLKKTVRTGNTAARTKLGAGVEDLPSWSRTPEGSSATRHHWNQYHEAVGKTGALFVTYLTGGKVKASWTSGLITKTSKAVAATQIAIHVAVAAFLVGIVVGPIILMVSLFGGLGGGGGGAEGTQDRPGRPGEPPAADGGMYLPPEDLAAAAVLASHPTASAAASEHIPDEYLKAYKEATLSTRVPWTVIAGIAAAATDHGRFSPYDNCDRRPDDGDSNFAEIRQFATTGRIGEQTAGNDDCGTDRGRYLEPATPIGEEDDPAFGHYLLHSSVRDSLRRPAAVKPVTGSATEYLVNRLSEIRESMLEEGWPEPVWGFGDGAPGDLGASSDFWTEAVSRLPLADAAALGCRASARDTASREAVLAAVRDIWRCVLSSADELMTYSYDHDQGWYRPINALEDRPAQVQLLLSEAEQAAGLWSDLGANSRVTSQDLCGRVSIVRPFGGDADSTSFVSTAVVGDLHAAGLAAAVHPHLAESVDAGNANWEEQTKDPVEGRGLLLYSEDARGSDMAGLLEGARPWIDNSNRLVLFFGVRDLLEGATPESVVSHLEQAVGYAESVSSDRGRALQVLWVNLYLDPDNLPRNSSDDILDRLEVINSSAASFAEEHPLLEVLDWNQYVTEESPRVRESPTLRIGLTFRRAWYQSLEGILRHGSRQTIGVGEAMTTDPLVQGVVYTDTPAGVSGDQPVGIFPLTQDVFDTYNSAAFGGVEGATRCDPVPNILAAAKAFANGEKPDGRDSGNFGEYRPRDIIGGWAAMPEVLGSDEWRSEFLERGKEHVQKPDELSLHAEHSRMQCSKLVGDWMSEVLSAAVRAAAETEPVDSDERVQPRIDNTTWPAVLVSGWYQAKLDSVLKHHAVSLLSEEEASGLDAMAPEEAGAYTNALVRSLTPSEVDDALGAEERRGGPLTELVGGMRAAGAEFVSPECAYAQVEAGNRQYSEVLHLWTESEMLFPGQSEIPDSDWLRENLLRTPEALDLAARDGDMGGRAALNWAQGMMNVHAMSSIYGITGSEASKQPEQPESPADDPPDGRPPMSERVASRAGVVPFYELPGAPDSAPLPKLIVLIAEAYGGLSGNDDRGLDDPRAGLVSIIAGDVSGLRLVGVPEALWTAVRNGSFRASTTGRSSSNGQLDEAFLLAVSHVEVGGPAGWQGMTEDGWLDPARGSPCCDGPFGLRRDVWNVYGNGSDDGFMLAGPAAEASGQAHLGILATDAAKSILGSSGPWDLGTDRYAQIVSAYLMQSPDEPTKDNLDGCLESYEEQRADGEDVPDSIDAVSSAGGCGAAMRALERWFVAEDYRRIIQAAILSSHLSSSAITHADTGFGLPVPVRGPEATSRDGCLVRMGGRWGDPRGTPSKPRLHQGIDIMDCNDHNGPLLPLFSVTDGVIVRKYTDLTSLSGLGWRIRHTDIAGHSHVDTLYLHMATFEDGLKVGDTVKAGQRIGTMGNTGVPANTTPIHLHFEVRIVTNPAAAGGGTPVNPISWIPSLGNG